MDFLEVLTRSMPWEDRAACRDTFDETTTRGTWIIEPSAELSIPRSVVAKLEVCNLCPVRAECLRFSLETGAEFGVWGGSTSIERKTLAPRPGSPTSLGYGDARREQVHRAEHVLASTHDERLQRWRGFAREADETHARGDRTFKLARRRITGRPFFYGGSPDERGHAEVCHAPDPGGPESEVSKTGMRRDPHRVLVP